MSQSIRVKNFGVFQHYKDRRPPWIKLYQTVLEDYQFTRLPDASKAHLMLLWLLASRYQNAIPCDAEWLKTALHATTTVDLRPLVSAGFIEIYDDASNLLATCKQNAMPEGEGEVETEIETTASSSAREALLSLVANRPTWEAEMRAMQEGMDGHVHATAAQIEEAASEFMAEKGHDRSLLKLRPFKAFVEVVTKPREARSRPTSGGTVAQRSFRNAVRALENEP